jgi:hypothetical protein
MLVCTGFFYFLKILWIPQYLLNPGAEGLSPNHISLLIVM